MKKQALILLMFSIFLLIGCGSKKFNVTINQVMADFGVNENGDTRFTIVIHSLDELKQKCTDYNNHYLENDYVFDDFEKDFEYEVDANQARNNAALTMKGYDDDFFTKNDLIICVLDGHPFGDVKYEVKNIKYDNEDIVIKIAKRRKWGVSSMIGPVTHLIVIEIPKRENNENINVEINIVKGANFIK